MNRFYPPPCGSFVCFYLLGETSTNTYLGVQHDRRHGKSISDKCRSGTCLQNIRHGYGIGFVALLESDERLKDFDFRKIIGSDLPFYANIGIAQLETLLKDNEAYKNRPARRQIAGRWHHHSRKSIAGMAAAWGDKITEAPIKRFSSF